MNLLIKTFRGFLNETPYIVYITTMSFFCKRKNQPFSRIKAFSSSCTKILTPTGKFFWQENFETAAYYSANQIKKIKVLKCELANQLDSRETLKSIADRYGMSLTALKDCFKAVYGKPIHAFQREYKMQAATQLLVTTKMSIAEIAGMVGYENPNKFSTAFKEIIGQSPSEYRKSRN